MEGRRTSRSASTSWSATGRYPSTRTSIIVLDYALRQTLLSGEDLGLRLQQRRSKRFPAETTTDLDFADDIPLLCNEVEDAQKKMLRRLKNEAGTSDSKLMGKKPK